MSTHGLDTSERYSLKLVGFLTVSAVVFYLLNLLIKRISLTTATGKTLNSDSVNELLRNAGLNNILASYATAQSAFETADFTSDLLKNNNNLFGMKTPDASGYAKYNTPDESAAAFVAWYTKHRNKILSWPLIIQSLADYVSFLKNQSYFEADEQTYFNGCEYYYQKYFQNT